LIDYRVFGVKPSNVISSLCYSVFRLEPYSSCSYSCVYCYARWYRAPSSAPDPGALVKLWKRIANRLSRTQAPKPYFRLSTLSEPFQHAEILAKLSLKLLNIAAEHNIPVVVNTKSKLVAEPPWLDTILKLSENKLVLVQVSATFKDSAPFLEPRAPSFSERAEAADKLREHGVPVVLRLQPVSPDFEEEHLEVLRELAGSVKGVVVESLIATRADLEYLAGVASRVRGINPLSVEWVKYTSGARDLYTPSRSWKRAFIERVVKSAKGLPVTTCKDYPVVMVSDCCLFWLTGNREYGVRETIRERVLGVKPEHTNLITDYSPYPNPVRKILRLHANKLEKVVASGKYAEFT